MTTTADTINLVCSIVALIAGALIFGWHLHTARLKRKEAEWTELPAEYVLRSYSVFIGGQKVGTCTDAGLILDAEESELSFSQLVPMDAPHLRVLLDAFRTRVSVSVSISPIDNGVLPLGPMQVVSLIIDTDMRCGTTTLETTLSGPSLARDRSIEAVFADIDQRAEKARDEVAAAL
jgi:hypothetical protein